MHPQVPKIPSRHCLPITFHDIHFWACVPSRFSRVRLFATLWTVVPQAPLSVAFSKQEYWSGCHFHLQGIFQTQGSNSYAISRGFSRPRDQTLMSPSLAGGSFTSSTTCIFTKLYSLDCKDSGQDLFYIFLENLQMDSHHDQFSEPQSENQFPGIFRSQFNLLSIQL